MLTTSTRSSSASASHPTRSDYEETVAKVAPLGDRARVLWTDGPKVQSLYADLIDSGIAVSTPGKGRSVWTAFGYLLDDPKIETFVLHDCDIVDYDRLLLARLASRWSIRRSTSSSAKLTTPASPIACMAVSCACWSPRC